MTKFTLIFVIIRLIRLIECEMEPFVVGGKDAVITDFPHSVYLEVKCVTSVSSDFWVCGGSIVNEKIILTAAHCIYSCNPESSTAVKVGHVHKNKGKLCSATSYYVHDNYNDVTAAYDIALVKIKNPLKFNKNVKRIAVMSNPPYSEKALIAGWGFIDEDRSIPTRILKYVDQYVWKADACKQTLYSMPKGTICASSLNVESYSSRGDSGSALVVRGYIQIGIVSYKMQRISKSLVVYTDTGYFYEWIKTNSRRLYCA